MGELGPCFKPIFGGCHQGSIASTRPVFNPVLGLRLGLAHLLFQTPSYTIVFVIIIVVTSVNNTHLLLHMYCINCANPTNMSFINEKKV